MGFETAVVLGAAWLAVSSLAMLFVAALSQAAARPRPRLAQTVDLLPAIHAAAVAPRVTRVHVVNKYKGSASRPSLTLLGNHQPAKLGS